MQIRFLGAFANQQREGSEAKKRSASFSYDAIWGA